MEVDLVAGQSVVMAEPESVTLRCGAWNCRILGDASGRYLMTAGWKSRGGELQAEAFYLVTDPDARRYISDNAGLIWATLEQRILASLTG